MIYISGDPHGELARFAELATQGEGKFTENDYLIFCGDFGYVKKENNEFLDMLEREKKYTICFCDGNHENFPELNSYPQVMWHGGEVHKIRENVIHLKRGQIYEIDGKKIFVFGGGYSRDRWRRVKDVSYWDEELPSPTEYDRGIKSLEEAGFSVDYIITHTAPKEIIYRMGCIPDPHEIELNGFLDWVMYETRFKKWFFGHWHRQQEIVLKDGRHLQALYFDLEEIRE